MQSGRMQSPLACRAMKMSNQIRLCVRNSIHASGMFARTLGRLDAVDDSVLHPTWWNFLGSPTATSAAGLAGHRLPPACFSRTPLDACSASDQEAASPSQPPDTVKQASKVDFAACQAAAVGDGPLTQRGGVTGTFRQQPVRQRSAGPAWTMDSIP